VGLLALLAACSSPQAPPIVGTLERHRIEVAAPANEQIVALTVREGDRVQPGQVLAELDSGTQTAQREALAAQVQQARDRLRELQNGARPEELDAAQARLASAQADLTQAEREFARLSDLAGRGLAAASQLDQQLRARDGAVAAVRAAQAAVQLLRAGTRTEQLAQARSALAAAEAQLAQQAIVRARLQLKAPVAGSVESIPYRLGERPPLGAPVIVLLAGGVPYARVYIPEPLRARVRAGDAVQVRIDGIAAPLPGTVRYVAGEASFTPYYALTQRDRSRLVYVAEIDVTGEAAQALSAGVPLQVELGAASAP
jgi:HlyD family secretion protein